LNHESQSVLTVQNLQIAFDMGSAGVQEAVRGISFAIPDQQTVALVGESGSGKSVTAMSLLQLLPDNARIHPGSQVHWAGQNLLENHGEAMRRIRGREISMVFQDPMSSLNPVQTVGDQIAEVLRIQGGMSAGQARTRVLELLEEVGLPEPRARAKAYAHQLSGGQQQRAMIALAIACEPRLLIADEPTTALDVTVQRQIIDLLLRLQQTRRMSMLFISHDLNLVGELAHAVVVLRRGVIREQGPAEAIFRTPHDPYTRALLACRPGLGRATHGGGKRLPTIEDLLEPQGGEGVFADPVANSVPGPMSGVNWPTGPGPAASNPTGTDPILQVTGLRKDYVLNSGLLRGLFGGTKIAAVQNASFVLNRGRTLGVVGESGSGKTTLGLMLTRLLANSAGEIRFAGHDLTALKGSGLKPFRRRIQIIFQNPYASLNPRFTVGQILTEPLRVHQIGSSDDEREALALQWLERVGLTAQAFGKYPHEFSGGQRQRIAIARCLTMQPEILVCDECVSALDVSVQATVLNLLLDLQAAFGLTYVFISHDLAVVQFMADEILVMRRGEIVEQGPADSLYANPQHPYTQQLLAAIPRGFKDSASASGAGHTARA
jgi:peptide/nickel transport system ATP-binding protein